MKYKEIQYQKWLNKYSVAQKNMDAHKQYEGALIEVAAQHPLIDGVKPNEEFEKRLCYAIDLYRQLKKMHIRVKLYVPGSVHMTNNMPDKVSLSKAGKNYLVTKGIDAQDIYGEEMNEKYKGTDGVYNSSDECFVACKIFDDNKFKEMHSVCSAPQMMRKVLSFIEFGFIPYMHTVSCDIMFHNYIDELFKNIPILIDEGNGLQGNSYEANRIRELRKPKE